jgi:acetolactate synthase small subunit
MTAVEWLFLQMENLITKAKVTDMDNNDFVISKVKLLKQAKEMEKQDKHSEYMRGFKDGYSKQELKSE